MLEEFQLESRDGVGELIETLIEKSLIELSGDMNFDEEWFGDECPHPYDVLA